MAVIADREDLRIPADARVCLEMLAGQLVVVKEQILANDRRIRASARETEVGRRLMEIPGVGPCSPARSWPASPIPPPLRAVGPWQHGSALLSAEGTEQARSDERCGSAHLLFPGPPVRASPTIAAGIPHGP